LVDLFGKSLGVGSFGEVFEAQKKNQVFAIKMIPDPGKGKESLEFVQAETLQLLFFVLF
jgi:hypothetical protein